MNVNTEPFSAAQGIVDCVLEPRHLPAGKTGKAGRTT
jgi:hypothetical protein